MSFDPRTRVRHAEILDEGTASAEDVRESLRDLRRINAWLGGRRLLRSLINEQLKRTNLDHFTLLDLGTGSGDLAQYAAENFNATVTGLDRRPEHMFEPGRWTRVAGDILALPFAPRSFDFVTANLVMHHFDDDTVVAALMEMAKIARHAVLINDLERHWIAWRFIRHAPITRNEVSRIDGATSVQQAFTRAELSQLAQRAGFKRFRVRKHLPFRLSLVVEL